MNRHAAIAVALATSLFAIPVAADDLDRRIADLIVRSGIDKQIDSYPDNVRQGMQQARAQSPLSDAQYQLLMDAVSKAYDPAAMKRTMAARLRKDLDPADIDAAMAWLNSPLGRRITLLEEEHSTPEAMQRMQAWVQAQKTPPPAPRMELIRRFDQAIGVTEFTVASIKHSQLAMVAAATATRSAAEQRTAFDKVNEVFVQRHAEFTQTVVQQTLPHMLYIYRSLTDAELGQYIAFAASPVGKRYHDATKAALDDAIVRASHHAGTVFGDALRTHKGGA
jgi:hypothetical protein